MAGVIADLLVDPAARASMAAHAREGVERFDWPNVIQQHLDLYGRARDKVGLGWLPLTSAPTSRSSGSAAA